MKARTYQANFTMGELGDDMLGRVDLAAYVAGVKMAQNGLPAVTGPFRRRAGFLDEAAPKYQDRFTRGMAFQRSVDDRLSLEWGHLYVRFFNPDGSPVLSGGVPYEIVSPYAEDKLTGIDFVQSNDVVYLVQASGLLAPYVLQRRSALDWVFIQLVNVNGPWRGENADPNLEISASGSIGAVTLTANGPVFQPGHVGSSFRLREQSSGAGVGAWTAGFDLTANFEAALSDGKVYSCPTGAASGLKTGTNPPVHEIGSANDGLADWVYVHDGGGVVRIDTVVDALNATGTVLATLPTAGVLSGAVRAIDPATSYAFGPSSYWAESAWSDYRGWPTTISDTDEERLAFGGTRMAPGFLALTRVGGFSPTQVDFHPNQGTGRVVDDDGITRTIAAGGDPILWLTMAAYLMVGSSSREYAFVGQTLDDGLTPAGSRFKRLTRTGSRPLKPVEAHDSVVFVPRGGRGLNMLRLSADQILEDEDLALFAEDIASGRIAGLAWAPHPDNVLWAWTDVGDLLTLVYHPKQKVFGWQRQPLAGGFKVDWAWVVHDAEGYDTVWLVVGRVKNGLAQRRIWRQAPRWRTGDPATAMLYLDGARLYAGPPAATLSGLGHLEGEEVRVLGDGGRVLETHTVAAGAVTVSSEVTAAVIGLRYPTRLEIMPVDLAGPAGTVGEKQRATDVMVYLSDFVDAEVRFGDGPGEPVGGQPWAGVAAPRTGVVSGKVGGVSDRQATVSVEMDDAWPGTVLAIAAKVTAND